MNLESELAVLQKQRDRLSDEIKATSIRLLEERDQKLSDLETEARKRLDGYRQEGKAGLTAIELVRAEKLSIESGIAAAKAEIGTLERRKTTANADLTTIIGQIQDQHGVKASLEAQVQYLRDITTPLATQIPVLEAKRSGLDRDVKDLVQRLELLDADYKTKEQAALSDIRSLLAKKDDLMMQLDQKERDFDEVGRKLGERQRAQDERDDNLRIREARVKQDERVVARNAGLLHL